MHYHPNPLDAERISTMIREKRVTVMLSTPTFLLTYLRRAKREQRTQKDGQHAASAGHLPVGDGEPKQL